jgi:hypothetical protein
MATFQLFFSVQGTGGSPTGPDLENNCCEYMFAFSGFCVICARCMHICPKLPTACAVGAFENETIVRHPETESVPSPHCQGKGEGEWCSSSANLIK